MFTKLIHKNQLHFYRVKNYLLRCCLKQQQKYKIPRNKSNKIYLRPSMTNCKTLLKDIKKDLNKWRTRLCFEEKIQCYKIVKFSLTDLNL